MVDCNFKLGINQNHFNQNDYSPIINQLIYYKNVIKIHLFLLQLYNLLLLILIHFTFFIQCNFVDWELINVLNQVFQKYKVINEMILLITLFNFRYLYNISDQFFKLFKSLFIMSIIIHCYYTFSLTITLYLLYQIVLHLIHMVFKVMNVIRIIITLNL